MSSLHVKSAVLRHCTFEGLFSVRGVRDAFTEHSRMVYRTAYGVTGNREDAQDILRTILSETAAARCAARRSESEGLPRSRRGESVSGYLKARRRRRFISHSEFGDALPAAETVEEDHRCLYKAVAALDPRSRDVIILHVPRRLLRQGNRQDARQGDAAVVSYCGACNYSWQLDDDQALANRPNRPKRSDTE